MKKVILFFVLILFVSSVYAACDVTDKIDKGIRKIYVAKGRYYNITFSSLKNESSKIYAQFNVNSMSTNDMEKGDKYIFNDLSDITIQDITVGYGSVNSTAQFCFNAGLSCINCGSCSSNKDCDDSNPCTLDECDGDPLRCKNKLILWCKDNDNCCPSKCTYENDNDCKILEECINDFNCDDNNTITNDICDPNLRNCIHTNITRCASGDGYCPKNCNFESDIDCDECVIDEDCNDNNACTSDSCSGFPKKCFNNATIGCNFNGTCVPIGTRTEYHFCNTYHALESLKPKKEYCDDNYECLSNYCIKNKCKSDNFIASIIKWFRGLF